MHIKEAFRLEALDAARDLVRAHPFATIITSDLRATHMPCLLDDASDGLAVVGHVAWEDPVPEALDDPVLLVFHGPHGYVSASHACDRLGASGAVRSAGRASREMTAPATTSKPSAAER